MKTLKIAADLKLPLDAATQTFAFIARKGAGKTYTAGKLVELLLDAGVQVVVLDTVGNWYGLRLAADGKGAGFDVPVLGGLRGDIPLDPNGGALIADTVVETGRSVILDASQWSKADRQRFAAAFGERLWLRKKGERHPSPLHLVIEESQLIVPQDVRGDTATMVGIYEEIIRLGRNYGIGVSMITQRPQSVNKEVLNQTECLFVGQVNGAQERDALKKWITHQGMDVHLVDELPGLPIGTFYVWSPQWLNLLQRVEILPKQTYDASATPKVGDKRVQRELKPLDLTELQERMAATIEKAKADDPKALRKQIGELKASLAKVGAQVDAKKDAIRQVDKPVLTDADRALLMKIADALRQRQENLRDWQQSIPAKLHERIVDAVNATFREAGEVFGVEARVLSELFDRVGFQKILAKLEGVSTPTPGPVATTSSRPSVSPRHDGRSNQSTALARASIPAKPRADASGLGKAEQRILDSLAWWKAAGIEQPTRHQVAFAARYTVNGHFNNSVGSLNTSGLVTYPAPGVISLTEQGAAVASQPESAADRASLIERAHDVLRSEPQRRIFNALVQADKPLTRDELATAVNYTVNGHFNNIVGYLNSIGVATYPTKGYVALGEMFDV